MSEYWMINAARWVEGTLALTDEQELAYFRILNWTHLSDQAPLANDKSLAKILKVPQGRRARRIVNELCDLGKLFIEGGRVHNKRADEELAYRQSKSRRQRAKDRPVKTPPNDRQTSANESETSANESETSSNESETSANDINSPDKPLKSNGVADTKTDNRIEYNRIDSFSGESSPPRKNGSRLSEDWEPTPDDLKFSLERGLTEIEIQEQFDRFGDYWRAKSGKDATKTDWSATFRNWIRKASDDKKNQVRRSQGGR